MSVAGWILGDRVRNDMLPYFKLYGECVLRDIMPAFNDVSDRAKKVADEEFQRLCSQPAGEDCDGDLSGLAETAQGAGETFYSIMDGLRQGTLNLYTVGLFHSLEHHLAELCRDASFSVKPPKDTKLGDVKRWYQDNFKLDLAGVKDWIVIDELRCTANAIKHGDGSSEKQLRQLRPSLFENPTLKDSFDGFVFPPLPLRSPLGSEDVFVTVAEFERYLDGVRSFVGQIAEYFGARQLEAFV